MTTESALVKTFSEFGGIDVRSNNVTRKPRFARGTTNVEYVRNNSISASKGQKGIAPSKGGGGTKVYTKDIGGVPTEETVTIDSNLHRLKEGTLTVGYSGSGDCYLVIEPDKVGDEYVSAVYGVYFRLYVDDVVVYEKNLGLGRGESSPLSIATLVTEVDALADFTCTATGATSGPAAFLPYTYEGIETSLLIPFKYWQQIPSAYTNPFSAFAATINTTNFELASMVNTGNRLFIATGYGPLYQYDGAATYRAGMPTPVGYLTNASGVAGNPNGTYTSFVTYEHMDANGNTVESDPSEYQVVHPVSRKIDHFLPMLTGAQHFPTFQAKVNGGQTGVTTITVLAGHTIAVGMNVTYNDGTQLLSRKVTAVTSTSITVDSAVTVLNNQLISGGMYVNIWRSLPGSAEIFYLVDQIPHDGASSPILYTDNKSDADLLASAEYIPPVTNHGLPPDNMKYLTVYKGLLIAAGNGDAVYFSDPDGPSYFADQWASFFTVRSKSNSPIRGVGANREILCVFKETEIHAVNGDLPGGRYRNEILADDIGCVSHSSIVDVDGTLWFHSGRNGPRRIAGNNVPDDVSYRVAPIFANNEVYNEYQVIHSKVVALNHRTSQLVIFFCPCETDGKPNENSFCMVADWRNQTEIESEYDERGRVTMQVPKIRWWRWNGYNLSGGGDVYQNVPVWTERQYFDSLSAWQYTLTSRLENNSDSDYTSFAGYYEWEYEGSWMDLGKPDLMKKFVRSSIYSFPEVVAPAFEMTAVSEINFKDDEPHSQKFMTFGTIGVGNGWGIDAWGLFVWGDVVDSRKLFSFLRAKSKALKLRFSAYVWKSKPVISGWAVEAVPAYKPRIKP